MPLDPSTAISALKWIGSLAIKELKSLYQVPEEVCGLVDELQYMVVLLQKVDAQEGNPDDQLRLFSDSIRELAFRSEDVIDTYFLDLHHSIENRSFLMKFACISRNGYAIHQIGKQIESITQDVQVASQRLQTYQIVHGNPEASSSINISERLQDAPGKALLAKEEFVIGIDNDIDELVAELCNVESKSRIVAIVGTGGAGKTTLARKVYSHLHVKGHFQSRTLVSISKDWSARCLLVEIIRQSMGTRVEEGSNTLALAEKLREFLDGKRFLIVLDDIWERDAWDAISSAFPDSCGSKILLTTRICDLPFSIDRSSFIHNSTSLTEEDRYILIHKIAIEGRFGTTTINKVKFELLARDMSKQCSGTPLAVVSLAGVLRTKEYLYEWERVNTALAISILKGKGTGCYGVVENMLSLSYYDLPPNLRPCLLYLAMYPEDWIIHSGKLIRLWISEGLVTLTDCQDSEETLEEVGIRFLDELVKRCLLITIRRNYEEKLKKFKVHDLVRDFCIEKAKEQCFFRLVSDEQVISNIAGDRTRARRLIVHRRKANDASITAPMPIKHGMEILARGSTSTMSLRSIIHLEGDNPEEINVFLKSCVKDFKLLKVLHLSCSWGVRLPDDIGSLKFLNCFTFSGELAGPIPKSIKNLKSLLTFNIRDRCGITGSLGCLSDNFFGKMEKLRHAYSNEILYDGDPRVKTLGFKKTKNLQVLSNIFAGEWMVQDLPSLTCLRKLRIHHFSSEKEIEALYGCPSLRCLQVLYLEGVRNFRGGIDLHKLRQLGQSCPKLWKLALWKISIVEAEEDVGQTIEEGLPSPIWLPENLVSLTLQGSQLKNPGSLAVISKLPYLRSLFLYKDAYQGAQLIIKADSFLQLEELYIERLPLNECKFEGGDKKDQAPLPCLRKLSIVDCRYLQRIPRGLQLVTTLKELCTNSNVDFLRRIEEGGEDYDMIQHIPMVKRELYIG